MYTQPLFRRSTSLVLTSLAIVGLFLFGLGVLVGLRVNVPRTSGAVTSFVPLPESSEALTESPAAPGAPALSPLGSASSASVLASQPVHAAELMAPTVVPALTVEPLETAPVEVPAPETSSYSVQVGVYARGEYAEALLATLSAEGYTAYLEEFQSASGSHMVSVRFGDYPSSGVAWTEALKWAAAGSGREAIVLLRSRG